jgi:hypothetical protein
VLSVLSPGVVGAVEITVLADMGVVSGARDAAPAFERETPRRRRSRSRVIGVRNLSPQN